MTKPRTTEQLRTILWDALEGVADGTMEPRIAKEIGSLSERILKTADLELRYASVVSRLDQENQGVNPGPLLLAPAREVAG